MPGHVRSFTYVIWIVKLLDLPSKFDVITPMDVSIPAARSLLDSAALIRQQAEELDRLTGAQFNVFDTLRLTTHENSHSLFIAELLNPRGRHGQGDIFLRAFTKQVTGPLSEKNKDDPLAEALYELISGGMSVITELNLGPITDTTGGRVDIALVGNCKRVYIENKIYAKLQHRQLERYLETKQLVLFLTLFEHDFQNEQLPQEENLHRITYEKHICAWLDRCVELSAEMPAIRESILQYKAVVEWLTNQGRNKIMENDLLKIISKDTESIKAFFALRNSENALYHHIGERVLEIARIVEGSAGCGLQLQEESYDPMAQEQYLSFTCDKWKVHNLSVGIQCYRNFQDLAFGVFYARTVGGEPNTELANRINSSFRTAEKLGDTEPPNSWWLASRYFDDPWKNWSPDEYARILSTQPNNQNLGDFGQLLSEKIKAMRDVVEETLPPTVA